MEGTGSEQRPEPLSASQGVGSQVSQTHIPGFLVIFLFLTLNFPFPLTSTLKRHHSARETAGENLTLNFGSVFFHPWVLHKALRLSLSIYNQGRRTTVIAGAGG